MKREDAKRSPKSEQAEGVSHVIAEGRVFPEEDRVNVKGCGIYWGQEGVFKEQQGRPWQWRQSQ